MLKHLKKASMKHLEQKLLVTSCVKYLYASFLSVAYVDETYFLCF